MRDDLMTRTLFGDSNPEEFLGAFDKAVEEDQWRTLDRIRNVYYGIKGCGESIEELNKEGKIPVASYKIIGYHIDQAMEHIERLL